MTRRRSRPRVPCGSLLFCLALLSYFSAAIISAAVVTLDSIEIYRTHEWLPSKPRVYFQCKGENATDLPDVKEKHVFYSFKGEESWQPLTELHDIKCKRCGFYEEDNFKSDDVFDEWEFCISDFTRPGGRYIHFKDKELNATFLCPDCVQISRASTHSSHSSKPNSDPNGMHWAVIVVLSVLASFVFVVGSIAAYKYWQKRKKQQEQARFLKLFEEVDDDEDELGLGPLSHTV